MCLAVPGRVVAIQGETSESRSGRIDFGGVSREVNLAFVPEVKLGDYVLVHVGFALSVIDEDEAQKTLELLKEMGDSEELEDPSVAPPDGGLRE